MSEQTEREARERLESIKESGRLETARGALQDQHPVLRELGMDTEMANRAITAEIEAGSAGLESFGVPSIVLEAIVEVIDRPPFKVRNDRVTGLEALPDVFPARTRSDIAAVERFLPSVGRIEFINHAASWGGTGWVVDEVDGGYLVMTNRHVAEIVARRVRGGAGAFGFDPFSYVRYGAAIDFNEEDGAAQEHSREARIEEFTYIADSIEADIALARIKMPTEFQLSPLDLADSEGEDEETVAVCGYPGDSPRNNDQTALTRYFQNLFGVKRFSPGFLMSGGSQTVLSHDCTTLGGNSGSPVISLSRRKVVGLHFAGQAGVKNIAVRVGTLRRLLDEGVSTVVESADIEGIESADKTHEPAHFEGREGYQKDFLDGVTVPLPDVAPSITLSTPVDATEERPHELRYQHFSVLYSGDWQSPVVAALNIDGARFRPIKRKNRSWFFDLRIPRNEQLGKDDYGDPAIDRGHLVRRAATNWGESDEEAETSNLDSYHYTNASPQHLGFNRNHAMWLGLENYILTSSKTHGFRACVFTGPVLSSEAPPLEGTNAIIPTEFWKVVSMLADDGNGGQSLHSTAYVLSQGRLIHDLLSQRSRSETLEGFAFGAYRAYQVRVSDLERVTGHDFKNLRDADPLSKQDEEALGNIVRPLSSVDDVLL